MLSIILSKTSEEPIYEQIKKQIKSQIINGKLTKGTLLPSIRTLAKELNISVITVKKAYEDLEKEGFILTVPARGTFVAEINMKYILETKLKEIEQKICAIIEEAKCSGIELKVIVDIVTKFINDGKGEF